MYKKIFKIFIGLFLIASLAGPAFADGPAGTGTIYFRTPDTSGSDPCLYLLFRANVGLDEQGKSTGITYTCTDAQKSIQGFSDVFLADASNHVTINPSAVGSDGELTEDAVTWIKDNINATPNPLGTLVSGFWGSDTYWQDDAGNYVGLKWESLAYGYYYIDSMMGSAVVINSTNPDGEVEEKNEGPGLSKTITNLTNQENVVHNEDIKSQDQYPEWVNNHEATVQIGDTMEYTIHITAKKAAENYVVYDVMCNGLALDPSSISIQVAKPGGSRTDLDENYYTLYASQNHLLYRQSPNPRPGTAYYNYTVTDSVTGELLGTIEMHNSGPGNLHDGSWGEYLHLIVVFDQEYLDSIDEDTDIFITYNCTVTKDAIIANSGGNYQNSNRALIAFGHESFYTYNTRYDQDRFFTAGIKVFKFDGDGTSSSAGSKPLNGVEFVLKNQDGKYLKQGADMIIHWVEKQEDATAFVTGSAGDGMFFIYGLTNGIYTLVETKALPGYNPAPDTSIVINNVNNDYRELMKQVNIGNKTGTLLPSTGGPGTSLIYITGIILLMLSGIAVMKRSGKDAA